MRMAVSSPNLSSLMKKPTLHHVSIPIHGAKGICPSHLKPGGKMSLSPAFCFYGVFHIRQKKKKKLINAVYVIWSGMECLLYWYLSLFFCWSKYSVFSQSNCCLTSESQGYLKLFYFCDRTNVFWLNYGRFLQPYFFKTAAVCCLSTMPIKVINVSHD